MKHIYAWLPKIQQIFLFNDLYVDESEQRAKLLVNSPLNPSRLPSKLASQKQKAPTGKPRPKDQLRKTPVVLISELPIIRVEKLKRLNRDKTIEISNKYSNTSGIVEKVMLVAKTSSRVYKPKIYKKTITNPIHSRQ